MRLALIACTFALVSASANAQAFLTKEPAAGDLRRGQSVMVDDGTCPKGQIKVVTSAVHQRSDGYSGGRTKTCIKRP